LAGLSDWKKDADGNQQGNGSCYAHVCEKGSVEKIKTPDVQAEE